jgi:Tol biopolymer transport system component
MTPRDLTRIRFVSDPQISPDGRRVAFVLYDRRPHIFVVPADGGEPRQITDGDFADASPAWSPDGRLIAFVSARHEERDYDNIADVWVVPPEGGKPRRVTDSAGPVSLPTFFPDGTAIAYLGHRYRNQAGRNVRLFTVSLAGGPPNCLTMDLDRTCSPFLASVAPVWSGNGEWILFGVEDRGNVPVYRVRAAGGPRSPAADHRRPAGDRPVDRPNRLVSGLRRHLAPEASGVRG